MCIINDAANDLTLRATLSHNACHPTEVLLDCKGLNHSEFHPMRACVSSFVLRYTTELVLWGHFQDDGDGVVVWGSASPACDAEGAETEYFLDCTAVGYQRNKFIR